MNFVLVKSFICNMKDKQKKTLKKGKKFIRNALLSNDFFYLLFIVCCFFCTLYFVPLFIKVHSIVLFTSTDLYEKNVFISITVSSQINCTEDLYV